MGNETGSAGRDRFEALYAAEGRRVLAYALRRTHQPADAADVLAEVFLVAWRRLDAVPEGDEARLWLYGVARRVLANHNRGIRRRDRLGRRLATVLTEHVGTEHVGTERLGADPAESSGVSGTGAEVRAALAGLDEADRELIQLTSWEGLSSRQVAAVLGIPAATVRTRLHRARGRLRATLTAEREGAGERSGTTGHGGGDERPLVGDREDRP